MVSNDRTVRALAVAAFATSVILTAAAFWLSYQHLHDVSAAHGLHNSTSRAWAWPATVDLFIIVGESLILRASLSGRVDWWAIALTVVGSLGSIALNVAGVGTTAPFLDQVVAAVPPVAALLAFGAIMRQIHEYITAHTVSTPETPDETPLTRSNINGEQAAETPGTPDEQPIPAAETPADTLITTREALLMLGISRATFSRHLAAGLITPHLTDPRRGNLFNPDHIIALRDHKTA